MQSTEREQRQDDLEAQMRSVLRLADEAGCYDAADWIKARFGLTLAETQHPLIAAPVSPEPGEGEARCECCGRRPLDGEPFTVHPEEGFYLCSDCVRAMRSAASCAHGAGRVDGLCKRCLAPVAPDEAFPVDGDGLTELLTSDEARRAAADCIRELPQDATLRQIDHADLADAMLNAVAAHLSPKKAPK